MELLTLNAQFQPVNVIENYESLIWAERYAVNGDFELTSGNILRTIQELPLDSYVSLRESTVPMVVTNYKITRDAKGVPLISVTGETFEQFALKKRATANALNTGAAVPPWTVTASTPSDAAYLIMRAILGDPKSRTRSGGTIGPVNPILDPSEAIPEIDLVLPNDFNMATPNSYDVPKQELYKTVIDFIAVNRHGIKSVRPTSSDTKVGVEIYNGANLVDIADPVVFDARFDQFDKATYLLGTSMSKNVAYVYGPNGSQAFLKTTAANPTGLARSVLIIDATSESNINTESARRNKALIDLYQNNNTALFEGEIGVQVAAAFNNRYFLGDIIQLNGEYGLSQKVRVAEFIRTSDAQGTKSYPTFEAIDAST